MSTDKPIQVFNRHCFFSDVSRAKGRPSYFSREIAHKNLLATMNIRLADIHYIYDEAKGPIGKHFLKDTPDVKIIKCGAEGTSFVELMNHIQSFNFDDKTIIYICEDDYIHRPKWCEVLWDGFDTLGEDVYLSLFDHPDKYRDYGDLQTVIKLGKFTHWRQTPSTTNTYAMKYKTFKEDFELQKKFSENKFISHDHLKFLSLTAEKNRKLYTSIPGFSTHAETENLSPLIDWENYV